MKSLAYSLTAAVAFLALPLHQSSAAGSEPPDTTVATAAGRTTIEFDADLLEALDELDIKVRALTALSWCTVRDGSVTLPIIGGAYDPESSTGEIIHRGGVVLKSDDVKVVLANLILEVTEGADELKLGMTVDVRVLVAQKDKVLVMPKRLVPPGAREATVRVQGGELRVIKLASRDDENVEILGGLEDGERIVISGTGR